MNGATVRHEGEAVFLPDLLDMNQRELALAEEDMMQSRY
jgi:hypothetical protein